MERKLICTKCIYFESHEYVFYCNKIKHPLENGHAMLCHAELAGCYDENGELVKAQRIGEQDVQS